MAAGPPGGDDGPVRTFAFRDSWLLRAPTERVGEVLADLAGYPAWWPQVLAVAALGPDDARVLCRSRLPYTLDLVLHAESREPPVLESTVSGDLAGVVRWRLSPDGAGTRLDFDQRVLVTGRVLGLASYAAGPLLRWNHDQMMAAGIAGLRALVTAPPG